MTYFIMRGNFLEWNSLFESLLRKLYDRSFYCKRGFDTHYSDVIMTMIASQITSLTVVYSTVYSDADQRKHQRSASLAFVWGIHRDRWIPRTKCQLRGKCFHLMTSSWVCFEWPTLHTCLRRCRCTDGVGVLKHQRPFHALICNVVFYKTALYWNSATRQYSVVVIHQIRRYEPFAYIGNSHIGTIIITTVLMQRVRNWFFNTIQQSFNRKAVGSWEFRYSETCL